MTGTQILNLMNYFGDGIPNYAGQSLTSDQALLQINWALRTISKRLKQWDGLIVWTLTAGTRSYLYRNTSVFSRKIVNPLYVVINDQPLLDANNKRAGLWTMAEADRIIPGWRNVSNGKPYACVMSGSEKLTLVYPPDQATVDAGASYVAGTYLAADLAALSETPDIPAELHECIAYLAAVRAGGVLAEGEVWNRMARMNDEWPALVDEHARLNSNAIMEWGTTSGTNIPDYFWT